MGSYLTEEAARWFQKLPSEKKLTLKSLFKEMRKKFSPEQRKRLLTQEAMELRMGENETIDAYKKRFDKAHILLPDADEAVQISTFTRSLTPMLKEDIILNQTPDSTLQELYERARLKYAASILTAEKRSVKRPESIR